MDTVWASGFFASDIWAPGFWANTAAIEVPDVVGFEQPAAESALTGAGFVVSATNAYSPSVPFGQVISQSPVGGSFAAAGSTVSIVVSLGAEPVPEGGGWVAAQFWIRHQEMRRKLYRQWEEEAEPVLELVANPAPIKVPEPTEEQFDTAIAQAQQAVLELKIEIEAERQRQSEEMAVLALLEIQRKEYAKRIAALRIIFALAEIA